MTWNYRAVRHPDGTITLREVYYDNDGNPEMMTAEPIQICAYEPEGESLDTIVDQLDRIRESILKHGVLDDPWPDQNG